MKQAASIFLAIVKALVYVFAWVMELTGKVLVTTSESIFKLRK